MAGRGLHIAVISSAEAERLQKTFSELGADKVAALKPQDALDLQDFDLVVLDLRKGVGLVETFTRIGRAPRPALVVIVSHTESAVDLIDAAEPEGILAEPLSPVQCRLVLRSALRASKRVDSAARTTPDLSSLKPLAPLTRRESDILELFVRGHRVKSIAKSCFVSEDTVRAHLKSVFRKLNVSSQAELMDLLLTGGKGDGQGGQDEGD